MADRHIRYADQSDITPVDDHDKDVSTTSLEAGNAKGRSRRSLRRMNSIGSMSIRSVKAARVVPPETVLPVTYRTVSVNIDEDLQDPKARISLDAGKKKNEKQLQELEELKWHTMPVNEIYTALNTSVNYGLSAEQIERRLEQYGRNAPTPPPSQWARKIFFYLFGGFGSILLLGSILVFVSWRPLGSPPSISNLALAIVLLGVFVIQAAFNAWQDWSSSRVMASITTMLPDQCTVIRDSQPVMISALDLVPGDVLRINRGDKLSCDIRFVEVVGDVRFDRSILTGESAPQPATTHATDQNYLETANIGLQGTHCVSGSVVGVCVATGDSTVFGRIAHLTNKPTTGLTPLQKEIVRFVCIIIGFILTVVIVVVVLWAAWLRQKHHDWISVAALIVDCVSVGVAFIPEGLPVAVAMSLTIGASIMRQNKILCKSLGTVETLGSVGVICSDKTGTLTKNEMFVTHCYTGREIYSDTEAVQAYHNTTSTATTDGLTDTRKNNHSLILLRAAGSLCNAADFDPATVHLPVHQRKTHGDPTDSAILRFCESLDPDEKGSGNDGKGVKGARDTGRIVYEVPFNSKNKFMVRIIEPVKSISNTAVNEVAVSEEKEIVGEHHLYIKGAPDILLPRLRSAYGSDGSVSLLTSDDISRISTVKDEWSRMGRRVILMAKKNVNADVLDGVATSAREKLVVDLAIGDSEGTGPGLTFIGIVGLIDPVREEIPDVIDILHGAGIRIMMVTGDFKLTAQAIAMDCGIVRTPPKFVHDISALERDAPSEVMVSNSTKLPLVDGHETDSSHENLRRAIVLSGPELMSLNDWQWSQLCAYEDIVFARTTPEQKLRIVREFQARENIVAMTGDGVNDAPALKAADIGVALGNGSDIAIEASDMVLLESFAAIVEAVKYGRVVYDNLKKTIVYLLPAGSFSELWPVMANVILGVPQILSSFLMIIICLFTDAAGAITLAYEKPEMDVLTRPPRNPKRDRLVNLKLIGHAYGFIGVYECLISFVMGFWYMSRRGIPFRDQVFTYGVMKPKYDMDYVTAVANEGSSIYFVNLVVMQFFNLLATRTRRLSIFQQWPLFKKETANPSLFISMIFALCIVFIFCYIPGLQRSVDTTSVPVEHFFLPIAFGLFLLGMDEARKYCVRRWPKGILARIAW
ncbi:hypothetical protein KEM56_000234 [Ascosphaera pollenicola]|nr:hypothetical protein KEM56_000234 [Ascosphaera pollenicola]